MESMNGMETMGKSETNVRMNQAYEKEVLEVARVSNEVRKAGLVRPAWYCPLLVWVGELMVSLGTRLKIHYSAQHSLRAR